MTIALAFQDSGHGFMKIALAFKDLDNNMTIVYENVNWMN